MFSRNQGGRRGFISKIILLIMICSVFSGAVPANVFGKDNTPVDLNRNIKILEIRGYKDNNPLKSELTGLKNATVTTMSMKKFVALRDELSGQYDVIYIGSGSYSTAGVNGKNHNTKNVMNDITNLKANEIKKDFIEKGQIVMLHTDVFKQRGSKLVTNFGEYQGNRLSNVIIVNNVNEVSRKLNEDSIKSIINKRSIIKELKVNHSFTNPKDGQSEAENTIEFEYEIQENAGFKSGALYAKIYLDANNNKQYENEELLLSEKVITSKGKVTYTLPPSYSGLRFLKFEIKNEGEDLKDYRENTITLKGAKVEINVLQVTVNDRDPSNLNNFLQNKLGGKDSDYEINIEVVSMNTFKGPKYKDINGKYDMLIFGFADSYNNSDIGTEAAKRIESFIETGQSVMFTHDTMFGRGNTWINYFADKTGQIGAFHDLGNGAPQQSNDTKKVNNGLILEYPFKLGDNIRIATTHSQYYGLDLEDPSVIPWYNIIKGDRDEDDSWNHYYTYSKGTVTYSGTGHTNNQYSNYPDEMNLFVNTMYTAFFGANHAPIITQVNPDRDNMTVEHTDSIDLKYIVNDLDLKDEILNTRVYFDSKEVLNRNVTRGTTINQSFTNPMPSGGKFEIKIEAMDKMGARAEKTIMVTVKPPIASNLKISREFNPAKISMGEKAKIEYRVTFPDLTSKPSKDITNIILTNKIPKGLKINEKTLPKEWDFSGDITNGYTLASKIPDVSYKQVYSNKYVADPITFEVEVEPLGNGVYTLEGGTIQFNDLDSKNKSILPNTTILTVETRVTQLKLDKKNLVIKKGQNDNLLVTVLPENASNKAVKWESSNTNIASVVRNSNTNEWEVTVRGHEIGSAVITVTSLDNEEIKDTCTVSVIHPVEGVRIDPSEAELRVAQTLALQAIFDPPDTANQNVSWSSSNPGIASVNENGVVVALEQGSTMITVTTEEGGLEAYSTIKVNPLLDPPDKKSPTLAGYGYVHPLSLAHMNMKMIVESEIKNANLTMKISDADLLFDKNKEVIVKVNDKVIKDVIFGDNSISIKLGDLIGTDKKPMEYNVVVYAQMKPASTLKDINEYNNKINENKKAITVSNKLKAFIKVDGIEQGFDFNLESYKLELIKIPNIN